MPGNVWMRLMSIVINMVTLSFFKYSAHTGNCVVAKLPLLSQRTQYGMLEYVRLILCSYAQSVLEWPQGSFNGEDTIFFKPFLCSVLGCLKAISLKWRCGSGHARVEAYSLGSLDLLWLLEAIIKLNQTGSISSLSTSCFWASPAVSWNPSEKQRKDCRRPQDPRFLSKQEPQLRAIWSTDGWNVLPAKLWARQDPAWLRPTLRWMWLHKTQSINLQ